MLAIVVVDIGLEVRGKRWPECILVGVEQDIYSVILIITAAVL